MKPQHPAWQALRATRQWRHNEQTPWARRLNGLFAVLCFALPAALALWRLPQRAAWVALGVLALVGLTAHWATHFAGLLRLDHPHAAHTVPGHSHALRHAALGLWAGLALLASALAAVGSGLLGLDTALGAWRLVLATLLGTGTLLLLVAAALRWWWLWVLAAVSPSLLALGPVRGLLFDGGTAALRLWQAQPLGCTLLLLALQGLVLGTLFGRGDAAHARTYARRERFRRAAAENPTGPKGGLAAYGRWGERLAWPGQALADAWLRRCLARPEARRNGVMARAEFVLHGTQHWVRQMSSLLFVQVCVLLSLWMLTTFTQLEPALLFEHGRLGIAIGVGIAAFSAVLNPYFALWGSRREQALLVLLPGMPQGAALNRALAVRQARHGLLMWAALLPAVGALLWAGHAPHALAFIGTALPLGAWVWRDHAHMRPAGPTSTLLPLGLCVLLGLLSMFWLSRQPAALGPWLLGLLALSAALLAWRWRVLQRLPQALPVGRLA